MSTLKFSQVFEEDQARRIDQYLARNVSSCSRTQIQELIKSGLVKCNNEIITSCRHKVNNGDLVEMQYEEQRDLSWVASAVDLDVLYEDDDLLVINKPAGLVMHPGAGQIENTVANALLHRYPEASSIPRAGVIHRLDKETSGICICAKTNKSYLKMTKAIKDRRVTRKYKALVHGEIFCSGFVDEPIGRHPRNRVAMAVVSNGKPAYTSYKILKKYLGFTWLELELLTGRTHQIRVHMASIKHPIAGDKLYNKPLANYSNINMATRNAINSLARQALHAYQIEFEHPISNEQLCFSSAVAPEINAVLATLEDKNY